MLFFFMERVFSLWGNFEVSFVVVEFWMFGIVFWRFVFVEDVKLLIIGFILVIFGEFVFIVIFINRMCI